MSEYKDTSILRLRAEKETLAKKRAEVIEKAKNKIVQLEKRLALAHKSEEFAITRLADILGLGSLVPAVSQNEMDGILSRHHNFKKNPVNQSYIFVFSPEMPIAKAPIERIMGAFRHKPTKFYSSMELQELLNLTASEADGGLRNLETRKEIIKVSNDKPFKYRLNKQ